MSDRSGEPAPGEALRGSAVVALLSGLFRGLPDRFELLAAARNSTVATLLRGSALFSALAGLRSEAGNDRSASEDRERSGESAETPTDDGLAPDSAPVSAASGGLLAGSALARVGTWFRRLVTRSWLYRWLTAEPDPDVVVIDLRETLTAGPILAVLDRVVGFAAGALPSSGVGSVLRGCLRLARARPIQLLSVPLAAIAAALAVRMVVVGSPSGALFAVIVVLAALSILGSRVTWSWERVRQSRGYRALAAAFEPPEPPEVERDRAGENRDDGSANER